MTMSTNSNAIGGIGTFTPPGAPQATEGGESTNPQSAGNPNIVTPITILERAPLLERIASQALSTYSATGSEQGHATGLTPEQQRYQEAVDARNAIIAENKEIKAANENINRQVTELERVKSNLDLLSGVIHSNTVFTSQDLSNIANDPLQTQAIREAARWMLGLSREQMNQYGIETANGLLPFTNGVSKQSMAAVSGKLQNQIAELKAGLRPEKEVPPDPSQPNSSSSPSTTNTSSSGSTGSGGTSGTGGTSGSAPTDGSKPPQTTPDEFRAKALENSNKVPAFSSSATTGEGRMQDGLQYCQNKLEALQSDLASAAARGDQGAISLINSEIAKFQAGLSALMQMMKQQQEVQSNMSKMFNDMAAAAIRNMR